MDDKQRQARNEAYQLLTIANRILSESGLDAYAVDVSAICRNMKMDSDMLRRQELNRKAKEKARSALKREDAKAARAALGAIRTWELVKQEQELDD